MTRSPKSSKKNSIKSFYLVSACAEYGHPVIFTDWSDCQKVVKEEGRFRDGVKIKKYTSFDEVSEALEAANNAHEESDSRKRTRSEPETSPSITGDGTKKITVATESSCKLPRLEHDAIHVYTDGACSRNGQKGAKAGWGVWFGPNDKRNCCGATTPATNQRAELQGILEALRVLQHVPCRVVVHSDSNYAMKCVSEWISQWKRNGWMNSGRQPVANQDLIKQVDALLGTMGTRVTFQFIKGHSGDTGNDAADELARRGARL
eukprot:Protomagalhaensia_sp_Gyna_25__2571@NODE_245_length_4207_cov_27_040547_g188_i0_p3_GENE_NODE_245_length_4207_cov_27_040547_g188_i0NODE_245_length_4207_cov_27_040547_g188_i0_p3_ORF_typecomplete_len262_score24_16RNase_H/PF00075_24/3_2e03RNase_H/PF00075_24/5e45RVT_3/PF13456_6/7_5e03RVT_3/PF13456_6/1_9e08Cauli_VI/PF01693_16/0_00032NOP5NT/PF08156_13/0_0022_NODE_245_length_4207_cov_27_040547_g188_i033604145